MCSLDLEEKLSKGTTAAILECTGDFYQENGSNFCTRSCYNGVQLLGNEMWLVADVFAVLSQIYSFVAISSTIIISCLAHKRM